MTSEERPTEEVTGEERPTENVSFASSSVPSLSSESFNEGISFEKVNEHDYIEIDFITNINVGRSKCCGFNAKFANQ